MVFVLKMILTWRCCRHGHPHHRMKEAGLKQLPWLWKMKLKWRNRNIRHLANDALKIISLKNVEKIQHKISSWRIYHQYIGSLVKKSFYVRVHFVYPPTQLHHPRTSNQWKFKRTNITMRCIIRLELFRGWLFEMDHIACKNVKRPCVEIVFLPVLKFLMRIILAVSGRWRMKSGEIL